MSEIINGSLRMMGDRILVKPLDWDASKTIVAIRHGRPVRGEVVAVGPGHNPIKYKPNALGKKAQMDYSKRFQRTEVKVGDIVELGGLNQYDGQGYQFPEVIVNGVKHIVCTERDVCIVRDDLKLELEPKLPRVVLSSSARAA
jgi:co-chaperonin GroES (HSP10)